MRNCLYILVFLCSISLFSQEKKVLVIADSTLANGLTLLDKDWSYQKGDTIKWADPNFDDSAWPQISNFNLNNLC